MKKAAIPTVRTGNPELDRAIDALKQNVDAMTGQARNSERIPSLSSSASLPDVIAVVNKILERMQ